MARPKIARKSTSIDMTAMCDVAFLLLSFFILTTKFKPSEAITVATPNSVASKVAPEKQVVLVTIDKGGKVFLSISDDDKDKKIQLAESINKLKGLNLNTAAFAKAEFWGTSFAQLPSFLNLSKEQLKGDLLPGIPVDTTKGANEMVEWMSMIKVIYQGAKMNLLLKGDNNSKYPAFAAVVQAFKKSDFLKFQMVTNPEAVPQGSDLYNAHMQDKKEGKTSVTE